MSYMNTLNGLESSFDKKLDENVNLLNKKFEYMDKIVKGIETNQTSALSDLEIISQEVKVVNKVTDCIIQQLYIFKVDNCLEQIQHLKISRDYYIFKLYNKALAETKWWKKIFKWQKVKIKNKIVKEIDEIYIPYIEKAQEHLEELTYEKYYGDLKRKNQTNSTDSSINSSTNKSNSDLNNELNNESFNNLKT